MNKSPAFQFYPVEYLSDESVQLMTLEQEGIYIRLLAYCWNEGSIPKDPIKLSMLCKGGSTKDIEMVQPCFNQCPENPDRLVHPRLEKERDKQREWREKSARGGKKSAETRTKPTISDELKGGSKMVGRVVQPKGNTLSLSPSLSINTSPLPPKGREEDGAIVSEIALKPQAENIAVRFEEFWSAYPAQMRKNRHRAEQAFSGCRHLLPPQKLLLGALEAFKSSKEWGKEDGRFITAPWTWLEERRWQDAPAYDPKVSKPPQKPVVEESDAFAWRAENYPESLEVHPTAATFPFKTWPESIRREYRNSKKPTTIAA